MTIDSELSQSQLYVGNGSTTVFAIQFDFEEDADVLVYVRSVIDAQTLLVLDTDYSISGTDVTYPISGDPLATGEKLLIVRDEDYLQDEQFSTQASTYMAVFEAGLDRLTRLIQQVKGIAANAIVYKETFDGTKITGEEVGDLFGGDPTVYALLDGTRAFTGPVGIGALAPSGVDFYIYTETGAVVQRIHSEDESAGVMQLQLYNDIGDEFSVGKLGSAFDVFGVGSGAILNRGGNMNIISDSNDPISFYTDATDSKNLSATEKMRLTAVGTLLLDAIDEFTTDAGVEIEGVLLKDGTVDGVNISALENVDSVRAKENGIQLIQDGAIYSFDDWDATDILTGSNAWPVPYKNALSNVFTGFEVVGWEGNGTRQYLDVFYGLNWIKNRDNTQEPTVADYLRDSFIWYSSATTAQVLLSGSDNQRNIEYRDKILLGSSVNLNTLSESYISWNWHYPCAKVWHAYVDGATGYEVPTPWGIKTSVQGNANDDMDSGQYVIELYNPLTGNGCLLYVGTGANRLLDFTGSGVAPGIHLSKKLSSGGAAYAGYIWHSNLTSALYHLVLNTTAAENTSATLWNSTAPTDALISLGSASNINDSGELHISYYFSPLAGLQNFGGYEGTDGAHTLGTECKDGMFFTKRRSGGSSGWNVFDHIRGDDQRLYWNGTGTETTHTSVGFNSSDGIDLGGSGGETNASSSFYVYGHWGKEMVIQDDLDVYPTDGVAGNGTNASIQITFEYEGAGALNSELLLYASRGSTPAWVLGSMSQIATLSDSKKLITATIDVSGETAGDELRWRLVTSETPYTEHNISNLKIIGV